MPDVRRFARWYSLALALARAHGRSAITLDRILALVVIVLGAEPGFAFAIAGGSNPSPTAQHSDPADSKLAGSTGDAAIAAGRS